MARDRISFSTRRPRDIRPNHTVVYSNAPQYYDHIRATSMREVGTAARGTYSRFAIREVEVPDDQVEGLLLRYEADDFIAAVGVEKLLELERDGWVVLDPGVDLDLGEDDQDH